MFGTNTAKPFLINFRHYCHSNNIMFDFYDASLRVSTRELFVHGWSKWSAQIKHTKF